MVKFVCDDRKVEIALRRLCSLVIANGGMIDEGLTILCQGGHLSIEGPERMPEGKRIIFIPEGCLVPVQKGAARARRQPHSRQYGCEELEKRPDGAAGDNGPTLQSDGQDRPAAEQKRVGLFYRGAGAGEGDPECRTYKDHPKDPRFPLLPLRRQILLTHPTVDQLIKLGLAGMARAFTELQATRAPADLSHAEWLALLLDREATERSNRQLTARLRHAKLRQRATIEDIDWRAPRDLDRTLFQRLIAGDWIDAQAYNLIIEGPTGVGKSWLACALGNKACRDNRSVLYQRVPKLFPDLALARGDGRYRRLMKRHGKVRLLILDDWGLEPFGPGQRWRPDRLGQSVRFRARGPPVLGRHRRHDGRHGRWPRRRGRRNPGLRPRLHGHQVHRHAREPGKGRGGGDVGE